MKQLILQFLVCNILFILCFTNVNAQKINEILELYPDTIFPVYFDSLNFDRNLTKCTTDLSLDFMKYKDGERLFKFFNLDSVYLRPIFKVKKDSAYILFTSIIELPSKREQVSFCVYDMKSNYVHSNDHAYLKWGNYYTTSVFSSFDNIACIHIHTISPESVKSFVTHYCWNGETLTVCAGK